MKKLSVLVLSIIAIAIVSFVACNRASDPISPTTEELVFTANIPSEADMMVVSDITECTMEQPMGMMFPKDDPLRPERPIKFWLPLGRILVQLNLTDEQKEQVKAFLLEYRDCVKGALQTLRESERAIIQAANERRHQVIEDLKNGVIDRQTAMEQLRTINQETRQALMENPVRQQVLQQLKDCFDALINNIKSILTDEQKALFEELLAKYKDWRPGKGPRG
jgi:Spy/CpxP family protein refolding chaperone